MPAIDLSILNQRQTPAFYASSLATRPAFGFAGRIFIDTDSPSTGLYRDTGAAWVQIADPGAGTTGTLQQVTTNGKTTNQGITITAGGLSSNLITIAENALSSSSNYINQRMGDNDFWRIYGTGTTTDQGEMVFLVGDNAVPFASGGERFRFSYDASSSGTAKDVFIVDYDISNFNTNLIVSSGYNLGVGVSVPSGLIHADGGASAARMIIDADNGIARIFSFRTDNLPRWALRVDGTETGSNVGGDFSIRRYDDTGSFVDAPLIITRSTGQSTFAKKVVIENNAGDQQLQIVSTTAPSLRIDNLQTGATKRVGIGLSTNVNNFIQGSVDRDFCVFNSSTTASPILFGIYDAGLTNTQEAARISPARNFIVGKTTDSGERLQISGTSIFTANNTAITVQSLSNTGYASITFDADTRDYVIGVGGSSAGVSDVRNNFYIYDNTAGLVRLILNSSGNLGINRSIPEFTLDVDGDIALPRTSKLQFTGGTAGDRQRSYFMGNPNNDIGVYTPSNNIIAMFHNSGNTLLGQTTNSGERLQVNGTSLFSGNVSIGDGFNITGNSSISIPLNATNYPIFNYAFFGIVVVRDVSFGGSGLFLLDPNNGDLTISSNLGYTLTFSYIAGGWQVQKSAGGATTITFLPLRA